MEVRDSLGGGGRDSLCKVETKTQSSDRSKFLSVSLSFQSSMCSVNVEGMGKSMDGEMDDSATESLLLAA